MVFLDTSFLKSDEIVLRLEKTVEGDEARNWLPAYHFAICDPTGVKMGYCDLRIGHSERVYYGGNIGYGVAPEYRGRHYAGKACLLLFELARRHGMDWLIITCNPDNWPSRRTCEGLGCELERTVQVPESIRRRWEISKVKCRYIWRLEDGAED